MDRLGRARGLIAYRALAWLESARPARLARPRVVVYGALLVAVGAAFGAALARRVPMDLSVAHNRDALYTQAADGRLGNSFLLRIENRAREGRRFHVRLESEPAGFDLVIGQNPIPIPATSAAEARVFVMAPPGATREAELRFVMTREGETREIVRGTHFLAPGGAHGS
jgi:polyferredoxin